LTTLRLAEFFSGLMIFGVPVERVLGLSLLFPW
jgi:hypothetical protein